MFTGLVEAKSHLKAHSPLGDEGLRLSFESPFTDLSLGESIAVSGACLTVVQFDEASFLVEASKETLKLTTLGTLKVGDAVNLERALRADDRLGGHMVTGHVDGMAEITRVATSAEEMTELTLRLPTPLVGYVAKKGSLTVEGVSLTVNEVQGSEAQLLLIPHTRAVTTLGDLSEGKLVNIEVDLIARYVERLLEARQLDS